MLQQKASPSLPELGRPEAFYAKLIQQAEDENNSLARTVAKVAQYLTLALGPNLDWPTRVKYFDHVLHRHCLRPASREPEVIRFHQELAELVRKYAGQEALRLASEQDDNYATRLGLGGERDEIESEADIFFSDLRGTG